MKMPRLNAIDNALDIAAEYHGIDGGHHKDWLVDQMVRALTIDEYYKEFVAEFEAETGQTWEVGIAP